MSARGFSLIELMIVISLFTITTIAVTTSYISFQGREVLKNAALQLKSDLRQTQNSAQTGDKLSNDSSGCISTSGTAIITTSLGGWYLTLTNGGNTYTVTGVCLNSAANPAYFGTTFGQKTINLPTGVTVSNTLTIKCVPTTGSTFLTGTGDYFYVFFRPLGNSVSFFSSSPSTPLTQFFDTTGKISGGGCLGTGSGEAVITLTSSDGSYEIHINQTGEIREKKI